MPTISSAEKHLASPVGQLLREWRAARGMSQFDLALHAGFSARHVSSIETGRTQPSRQALLVLAETLVDSIAPRSAGWGVRSHGCGVRLRPFERSR